MKYPWISLLFIASAFAACTAVPGHNEPTPTYSLYVKNRQGHKELIARFYQAESRDDCEAVGKRWPNYEYTCELHAPPPP